METLQIRLPNKLLKKVDQLISTGLYSNRSQILRQAVQNFISDSNYNGSLPFIVGPYTKPLPESIFDMPLDYQKQNNKENMRVKKFLENLNIKELEKE